MIARQLGTLSLHPRFQLRDQAFAALLTNGLSDVRALTVDVALDAERGIDPLHHFQGDRRERAGFLPCARRGAFASTPAIA